MKSFAEMIRKCDLHDLGFSGPKFTWSNMRSGAANVQERLDRALGNHQWIIRFLECRVTHLPQSRSDHHPIMVHDVLRQQRHRQQGVFKLQAAWFTHPAFETFLQQCWMEDRRRDLVSKLEFLKNSLGQWNRQMFGNIFDRKYKVLA